MRLWLALLAGLSTPQINMKESMMRVSKMLDNLCWCWIVSVALRYSVYAFVVGLLALILLGKS